jgi:MFS transporter, OFA family, oxalate/formate antiporter
VSAERAGDRRLMVAAALVVQMCLGAIYAWSVYRPVFEDEFGWTPVQTGFPYQASLLFFAVGMIVGGRLQDRVGPRRVVLTGGILLTLGIALTGVVAHSVGGVTSTYGVLGGLGVGFGYSAPIATLVKWFPDRRGLITGVAVFGFGMATVVFAPVISTLLTHVGITWTFFIVAGIFLVLVCGAGSRLHNPPVGWAPPGWTPPEDHPHLHSADSPVRQTIRTWQFWAVWGVFFIGAGAGLMTIGRAKSLGLEVALAGDSLATLGVMLLGLFNAAGRLAWGYVSDHIGRLRAIMLMFVGYLVAFLALLPVEANVGTWLAGTCLVGFCFGGFLAVMPSLTADFYGVTFLGANYGALYTAYGVAGVAWPNVMDEVSKFMGGFTWVWYIVAAFCGLGLILAAIVRSPRAARC